MPLIVLLPQKTRKEGDFCVIEPPLYYESKEPQRERDKGCANGQDCDKKQ